MPPNSPTVPTITVRLDSDRTVRFDYATIDRIEQATGLGFQAIADQFWGFMPSDVPDGGRPTPEQIAAASRKFRVGFAARFVAGCVGVSAEELSDLVGLDRIIEVFNALAPGFVETFNAMAGSAAEKKGDSTPSPNGGPGPASTPALALTSSDGSDPASSATSSGSGGSESAPPTSGSESSPP